MDKNIRRPASPLKSVELPKAPPREPSRMMGLLIVDVLAARKVETPAPKAKKPSRKTARG